RVGGAKSCALFANLCLPGCPFSEQPYFTEIHIALLCQKLGVCALDRIHPRHGKRIWPLARAFCRNKMFVKFKGDFAGGLGVSVAEKISWVALMERTSHLATHMSAFDPRRTQG